MVFRLRTNSRGESLNRLNVVVEDVRPDLHYGPERFRVSLEIRDENLHRSLRAEMADRPDCHRKDHRPTIRELITCNRCDHCVSEAEGFHRLGNPPGLPPVNHRRPCCRNRTEPTPPCACIPEDHKRRRPVPPTFPDIRTDRTLTHSVQLEILYYPLQTNIVRTPGSPNFQPFWTTLTSRGIGNWWRRVGIDPVDRWGEILHSVFSFQTVCGMLN